MCRPRYALIDTLRGLSLLSMVLYHLLYDFRCIFHWDLPGYSLAFDYTWQQSICWTFILLSGVCRHFSMHHFRRGLTVLGCGLLIELVTTIAMPSQAVHFGILSFVGCAILITTVLRPLLQCLPSGIGCPAAFALFLLLRGLPHGYIGLKCWQWQLPQALYHFRLLAPLGLPDPAFSSSDYFPLLPWFFLFLTGYFLWDILNRIPACQKILTLHLPFFDRIGRNTLPIYLLHQPVIMAVLTLFFSV